MAEREKAPASTAAEIWWNNLLMGWKIRRRWLLICVGASIMATAAELYLTSHENIYIFLKFVQSFFEGLIPFNITVDFAGAHPLAPVLRDVLLSRHPILCFLPLVYFVASSAVSLFFIYIPAMKKHKRDAVKLLAPIVIEGTEILNMSAAREKLGKEGKREKDSLPLCSLWLPKKYENYGLMINGSQGTGKSSAIEQGIGSKQGNSKCIIHDPTGEFVEKFYLEGRDIIWNPLDSRCVPYNFYTDIEYLTDIEGLSGSYFPKTKNPDSNAGFFVNGASDVFYGGVHIGFEQDTKTMAWLWEFCAMSTADKRKILSKSPAGARGLAMLGSKDGPQSNGIQGTLMQFAKPLQWMGHLSGNFSLKTWLGDGNPGNLFISNMRSVRQTLMPILSCFLDQLFKRTLALEGDNSRRIWYFIDELGQLQKLPELPPLLTQGRKYGASVVGIFQSIAQLLSIYGREHTDDMLNCFSSTMSFRCTDGTTARYIAQERIGEQTVEKKTLTPSYGLGQNRDGASLPTTEKTMLAVIPATIMNLPNYECYIKVPGGIVWKDQVQAQHNPKRNEDFMMRPGLLMAEIMADLAKLKEQTEAAAAQDPWGLKKEEKGKNSGKAKALEIGQQEQEVEEQEELNSI